MMRASGWALLVLAVAAIGCDSKPERPDRGESPSLPPRPTAVTTVAALGQAVDSSVPAASVALPDPPPSEFAGIWEGSYDARKGAVVLPDRVKDKTRVGEDGKSMSGPGRVEISIAPAGDVAGRATGALGEARLTGKLDEGNGFLRVSWYPEDATKPNAMTGVLIGPVKDGVIHAEIRVAGPDASLVRESKIELKKR